MQNVILKWYGPYDLQRIESKDVVYEHGVYSIYRVYNNNEKLLYIGKTSRNFLTRLKEHVWLHNVRGQIRVRLGIIQLEDGQRFSSKRLGDVESLLITWHSPPENTTNANYYYGRKKLTIVNIGRRGQIEPKVSTDDLE